MRHPKVEAEWSDRERWFQVLMGEKYEVYANNVFEAISDVADLDIVSMKREPNNGIDG